MRPTNYLRASLVATGALLLVSPAFACNKRKAAAPDTVTLRQLSDTAWQVLVPGYETTAVPLGVSYCAIGVQLPAASPISAVSSVSLFETGSSASMPRYGYAASSGVATAFNAVSAGSWTGFLSQVTGPDAGGQDHFLSVILTVGSGTTQAQMETALKASVIAIDQATVSGSLLNKDRNLMTPTTVAAAPTLWLNEKIFHNAAHTNLSTRGSNVAADVLYHMPPKEFRFGQGAGNGWRGVLQDSERSTAEVVDVGYIAADATGKPDLTAGPTTNVRYTLFGTGTGGAALLYTLTVADAAPLPRVAGVRLVLPTPRNWPSDACTVHTQDGTTSKVQAALQQQWTYTDSGATVAAYRSIGSTLRFGALHDCGVVRSYTKSTAYQTTAEALEGPESLFPTVSRGDEIGFIASSQQFAGAFGIIFLAPDYLPNALPTPFKDVLVQTLTLSGTPFVVPANGTFDTGSVPLPANISFAFQAIFFQFSGPNVDAAFSDAMLIKGQN